MTKGLFLCLAPGNNTGKKTPKKSVFMGKAPRRPEEAGQEDARWPQRALRKVRFKWPRSDKIKPPPPDGARPAHDHGDADAAFVEKLLAANVAAAVIANEEDEGVVSQPLVVETLEQGADFMPLAQSRRTKGVSG
jgi:hypothetical protein